MSESEMKQKIETYLSEVGSICDESENIYFETMDGVSQWHIIDLCYHLCSEFGKEFAMQELEKAIFGELR